MFKEKLKKSDLDNFEVADYIQNDELLNNFYPNYDVSKLKSILKTKNKSIDLSSVIEFYPLKLRLSVSTKPIKEKINDIVNNTKKTYYDVVRQFKGKIENVVKKYEKELYKSEIPYHLITWKESNGFLNINIEVITLKQFYGFKDSYNKNIRNIKYDIKKKVEGL